MISSLILTSIMMLKVDIEQALIQLRVPQRHVIAKNVYRKTHTTFRSENKLTKMTIK